MGNAFSGHETQSDGAVPEEEKVSLSKTSLQFLEKTLLNEKINKYRVDKEKDNGEERDHLPPSQKAA